MTLPSFRPLMLRAMAPLLLAFTALMGLHGNASAATTTQSAAMCKPWGNSNAPGLWTYTGEVSNASGAVMSVACPVVRTTEAAAGGTFSVWVDGSTASGTTSCTLSSWTYTETFLGSTSFTATGGVFDRLLTLPAAQVPMYSSQFVFCSLPANGTLYDIEPAQ